MKKRIKLDGQSMDLIGSLALVSLAITLALIFCTPLNYYAFRLFLIFLIVTEILFVIFNFIFDNNWKELKIISGCISIILIFVSIILSLFIIKFYSLESLNLFKLLIPKIILIIEELIGISLITGGVILFFYFNYLISNGIKKIKKARQRRKK